MKTLTSLALLPLMAAAASAYTLDVAVGASSPSGYDSNSIVGLGFGTQLNNDFHLGLNLNSKKIVNSLNGVDASARAATIDLTYELNGNGGIRPFPDAGRTSAQADEGRRGGQGAGTTQAPCRWPRVRRGQKTA